MNTFKNNYDSLEQIIFEGGLRIKALYFHKDMDLMLVLLNNKRVMRRAISHFERLKDATELQLRDHKLIAHGVGVHWPQLDEDLSLKGFLKEELIQVPE